MPTKLFILAALVAAASILGPAALAQPRVSPAASVSQVVGVTDVEITYGRPSVREREIWGGLEPWGKVWRTGANEATTFTISTDAKIEGKDLAAGKYALFTIPEKDGWTVIFNKVAEQWGAYSYDESQDALRVEVQPEAASHQEQLEFSFSDVTDSSAVVSMRWEKLRLPLKIEVDTPSAALAVAKEQAAGGGRVAWNWANYFYQNAVHTETALEWATQVAEQAQGSPNYYWTVALRARLENRAGHKEKAVASAREALEAAAGAEGPNAQVMKQDAETLKGEMETW